MPQLHDISLARKSPPFRNADRTEPVRSSRPLEIEGSLEPLASPDRVSSKV